MLCLGVGRHLLWHRVQPRVAVLQPTRVDGCEGDVVVVVNVIISIINVVYTV